LDQEVTWKQLAGTITVHAGEAGWMSRHSCCDRFTPTSFGLAIPSSQAFRQTPKDEKKLSVYDSEQITPVEAYQHYTEQ